MDRYAMGDTAAFCEVYSGLAGRLLPFLQRRIRNDAIAEELLQQTFLQMHQARGHYTSGTDVVPWAFTIARRLAIDTYRKLGREIHAELDERASHETAPDEALATKQATSALACRVASLTSKQREVFELVKLDGLSNAQVAQRLGTTVTAVKLRVHRACEALSGTVVKRPWQSESNGYAPKRPPT